MSSVETVKVHNPAEEGGYMIINKSDFDKDKHKLFEEKATDAAKPIKVGKDNGKFVLKRDGQVIAGPFEDEETAKLEKAAIEAAEAKSA